MVVNHWKTSMRCYLGMKKDEKVMVVRRSKEKFPQWTIEIEIFLRIIDGLCRRTLPLVDNLLARRNPSNIFSHAFKFLAILLFLFVRPLWRTNAINEQGRVILVKTVNADLFCFAFIQNSDSVIKKFYLLEAHLTR